MPRFRANVHRGAPVGVMSCDEIRYWLTELMRRGWGHCHLTRLMGIHSKHCNNIKRKANGKEWLYWGEQVRFSRQLKRILSGELVQVGQKIRFDSKDPHRAVLAKNPVPLVPPNKWVYDPQLGRLRLVSQGFEPPLPSFQTLFPHKPENMHERDA